jgi:hypothetical protein
LLLQQVLTSLIILQGLLVLAQGEEKLGVVVVEDLVRDAGSVDAAKDLDVGAAVEFRKVVGESAIERNGEQTLEVGSSQLKSSGFVSSCPDELASPLVFAERIMSHKGFIISIMFGT